VKQAKEQYMRDPNIRFSLDVVALKRLQALADQRNLSIAALLRNLVYQAINQASQVEKGVNHEQPFRA
jgi:hypothetical protein